VAARALWSSGSELPSSVMSAERDELAHLVQRLPDQEVPGSWRSCEAGWTAFDRGALRGSGSSPATAAGVGANSEDVLADGFWPAGVLV
jgi:hypothetical protein